MEGEDILTRICRQRRADVAAARAAVPLATLQEQLPGAPPAIDFAARVRAAFPAAVMAEIKVCSCLNIALFSHNAG